MQLDIPFGKTWARELQCWPVNVTLSKSGSVCGSECCVLSKRMQDRVYNMDPGASGLPLFINNIPCSCTQRCGAFQLNKLHGSINLGPTMCSVLFLQTPWPNNHWDSCQWSEEEEKGLSWRELGATDLHANISFMYFLSPLLFYSNKAVIDGQEGSCLGMEVLHFGLWVFFFSFGWLFFFFKSVCNFTISLQQKLALHVDSYTKK